MKSIAMKEDRVRFRDSGGATGSTLAELLTVIRILALLVTLLLPFLSTAREQSRRIVCMSNVLQLATGMLLYVEDDTRESLLGKRISKIKT